MKTVLFIEDEVKAQLGGFDFLLDNMKPEYDISVCRWCSSETEWEAMVPGLEDLLEAGQPWRAVVLCDLTSLTPGHAYVVNPFDFQNQECPVPPVHTLAQVLGQVPESFLKDQLLPDGTILEGERLPDGSFVYPYNPQVNWRRCYAPSKSYHVTFERPRELFLVTPRSLPQNHVNKNRDELPQALVSSSEAFVTDDDESAEMPYRHVALGLDDSLVSFDSMFWEGNTYPSNARYFIYDRPEPPSLAYEKSLLAMQLCLLQLCAMEFEAGELEAYKLYALRVVIDEERLKQLVVHRQHVCDSILGIIPDELARVKRLARLEHDSQESLETLSKKIDCNFELADVSGLMADKSRFGIAKDVPRAYSPDHYEWGMQKHGIFARLQELLKTPRRAVARAADAFARDEIDEVALKRKRLDPYLTEDLDEYLQSKEVELASSHLDLTLDPDELRRGVDKEDRGIATIMARRPYAAQLAIVAGIVAATFLFGCIPFILGPAGGMKSSFTALIVSAVCLAIILVVGAVVVYLNYRDLMKWFDRFNLTMGDTMAALNNAADQFTSRISSYATWRMRNIAREAQKHAAPENDVDSRLEELIYISALATSAQESNAEWLQLAGVPRSIVSLRPLYNTWGEVHEAVLDGALTYPFCFDTWGTFLFNGVREIATPYDFIRELKANRLHVPEPTLKDKPGSGFAEESATNAGDSLNAIPEEDEDV